MRIASNRAALGAARRALEGYRRVLPALDLKHRTLLAARGAAERRVREMDRSHAERLARLGADFPMLAGFPAELSGRLAVALAGMDGPRIAGVATAAARGLVVAPRQAGRLADPPFLCALDRALGEALAERVALAAERKTRDRLERAAKAAARRLNLVEKVLIPEHEAEIRRVAITLADRRRAAVVTARLAKARRSKPGRERV